MKPVVELRQALYKKNSYLKISKLRQFDNYDSMLSSMLSCNYKLSFSPIKLVLLKQSPISKSKYLCDICMKFRSESS